MAKFLPDDNALWASEAVLWNLLATCEDPKKAAELRRQAEIEFEQILNESRDPKQARGKIEKFGLKMMVLGMAHMMPYLTAKKEIGEVDQKLKAPSKQMHGPAHFSSTELKAPGGDGFDWANEKRLWYNSPMKEEERRKVIGEHFKFCKLLSRKPPGQVLYEQFERAIRRHVRLTYKQWQAASLVAWGLDDKEISTRLKISERMVKTHLQAVRRKAHLTRRSEMVRWYLGL